MENEENWETQEVIAWLINDEYCYTEALGEDADTIEAFVREGNAPPGLYASLDQEKSSLDYVDWDAVEQACVDE